MEKNKICGKKVYFSFVFTVSRGERCENGEKKCFYSVMGVMVCQTD